MNLCQFCCMLKEENPNRSKSPALESVFGAMEMKRERFLGWVFIAIGSISFVGFVYAAVLSKLLPHSDNAIISAIQNDWYYCFLVPLTLPVLMVAVYFHWLGMKLFKHA